MRIAPRGAATAAAAVLLAGCLSTPDGLECELQAVNGGQLDAQIGTNGGSTGGANTCGTQVAIGVGFWMTLDPNTNFHEQTAIRATLRCATLAYHDGAYEVGAQEDLPSIGGSVTRLDGPFFTECPRGSVVIGLAANIVGNGGLFNSISVDCAALDAGGAPTGDITRLPMLGTGTAPIETEAACKDGRTLHAFESLGGSELDQLKLRCAQSTCGPP